MNAIYLRPLFFAFSKNTPADETAFPLHPPPARRRMKESEIVDVGIPHFDLGMRPRTSRDRRPLTGMTVLRAPDNHRSIRLVSTENLDQCRADRAFDSRQLDHVVHRLGTLTGLCTPDHPCAMGPKISCACGTSAAACDCVPGETMMALPHGSWPR